MNNNSKIMAVDPGPEMSAFVIWDGQQVVDRGICTNDVIRSMLFNVSFEADTIILEEIECYGMPVGKTVFKTVFESGQIYWAAAFTGIDVYLLPRRQVKLHLCGNNRAKDGNVIQALVDRFCPYEKNRGKGTKKQPGFFYGFKKDIWQAFALAVTWWDLNNE